MSTAMKFIDRINFLVYDNMIRQKELRG